VVARSSEVAETTTKPSPLQKHSLGDTTCQTGAVRQSIDWTSSDIRVRRGPAAFAVGEHIVLPQSGRSCSMYSTALGGHLWAVRTLHNAKIVFWTTFSPHVTLYNIFLPPPQYHIRDVRPSFPLLPVNKNFTIFTAQITTTNCHGSVKVQVMYQYVHLMSRSPMKSFINCLILSISLDVSARSYQNCCRTAAGSQPKCVI